MAADGDMTGPAMDPMEIVATLREGLLVLTEDLRVEYASDRFLAMFDVSRPRTVGAPLTRLGDGQWNIPSLLAPLDRMLQTDEALEGYEVEHDFERIGRRVMRLDARKTVRAGNGSRRILLVIDDVTQAADHARELGRLRGLAEGIVDTLREPLLVLDGDLRVVTASRAFYQTFEVSESETLGARLSDLGDGQWANPALLTLLDEIIPGHSTIEGHEITQDFPSIGRRTILMNARKIFREGDSTGMILLAMEDVTGRRRLEAERAEALARSERLLEELNHRVMNSLSMIGAIIAMEGRQLDGDACRTAFERMRVRIGAVGALYRTLSRTAAVDTVGAQGYLGGIVAETVASLQDAPDGVRVCLDIEDLPLSTRIAVPLGLIVNELATNALKYAFRGRDGGTIALSLATAPDEVRIVFADDGPGIDPQARVDSGLGGKLVDAFVRQLDGEMRRESDAHGTRYRLTIPADAPMDSPPDPA